MNVHDTTDLVSSMQMAARPIRDLMAGGAVMRAAGQRYLPKFSLESEEDYKQRRESTWLFNGVKKARDDMAGKVFEKPVTLAEQEGQLFDWCQNVDLEGRDLSNFANDVFKAAIADGITFVMVDAPPRAEAVTRGQAEAQNLRPYMAHVKLDAVLGWKWENINSAPVITQWRMMEQVEKPDRSEFSDETVEQIRGLFLEDGRVIVRLYQKSGVNGVTWAQVGDDQVTDLEQIQIVPVYTGRTGFFMAEPPLSEIAEINLAHWRVQSDKSSCLHKSLSPLLLIKGIEVDGGQVVNSAGYAFQSSAEHADLKWAEITGNGIEAASGELRDLERQMQWQGLQLIMERAGVSTATGDMLDEGKTTSKLKSWADNLKDSLEIALGWMVDMGGIAADITVVVHKEFSVMGHLSMGDIRDMFNAGAISRETYIAEAQRRGVLSEDIIAADEAERIESEGLDSEVA